MTKKSKPFSWLLNRILNRKDCRPAAKKTSPIIVIGSNNHIAIHKDEDDKG